MSISSDIGVALKQYVYDSLSQESKDFLESNSATTKIDAEGVLYVMEDMRNWPTAMQYRTAKTSDDRDSERFLRELDRFSDDSFYVVEACHDYPNPEPDTLGSWHDNPWNLCQQISVSIYYNGV